jgi:peptidoglycan/xylan/chitin deacetylase (PgdA/CDA1 family)
MMKNDYVGPRLAITFEAGGIADPMKPILDALASAHVKATFFLDGKWAEANVDWVRRIADEGHELGNHGFNHPDWTALSDDEVREDLAATEELARRVVDREVRPWARPPYGAIDARVTQLLDELGYHAVYRDAIDGGHWPGETNEESICERAIESAAEGGVIVLHTNVMATARALSQLLSALKARGFSLCTLSDLGHIPTARLQRHRDFDDLAINPGYIRPKRAGRWQSLNLLEMGALAGRPSNRLATVATVGDTGISVLSGDQLKPMEWLRAEEDHRVLVLSGDVRCDFRDRDGSDLGCLIARNGDLFLCPGGTSYQLSSVPEIRKRWIAVVWRPEEPGS